MIATSPRALMRLCLLAAILPPLLLLGGAISMQHMLGLHPCELCLTQRHALAVAIALATAASILRRTQIAIGLLILSAIATAASGLVAIHHAGIERGWWSGLSGCSTTTSSAGMTDEQILSAIMNAPLIRCDVPQWTLGGLSLADLNAFASMLSATMLGLLIARLAVYRRTQGA